MDKIKTLNTLEEKMQSMHLELVSKVNNMTLQQLKNLLSKEIATVDEDNQKKLLIEKYKHHNPLYSMLQEDLQDIKDKVITTIDKLRILNVDPRYLESIGFKEEQIDNFYAFINKITNS